MSEELKRYMKDVCKHDILTREEELELAIKAKAGDSAAREKLIVCNLRFVVQIANKYKNYTLSGKYSIMDLIQEGNHGIVWAVGKYDYEKGYRFTTYAVWWIRAKILNFIMKMHSMVKVGTTQNERKLFFKMGKIKDIAQQKDTEVKDIQRQSLAKELKTTESAIAKMEGRVYFNDSSMDAPIGADDGHPICLGDLLSTNGTEKDLDSIFFEQGARDAIEVALKKLTERERDIIELRWLSRDGATLQEVANKYLLSRERIRQIESSAFIKMKKSLQNNKLGQEVISSLEN